MGTIRGETENLDRDESELKKTRYYRISYYFLKYIDIIYIHFD